MTDVFDSAAAQTAAKRLHDYGFTLFALSAEMIDTDVAEIRQAVEELCLSLLDPQSLIDAAENDREVILLLLPVVCLAVSTGSVDLLTATELVKLINKKRKMTGSRIRERIRVEQAQYPTSYRFQRPLDPRLQSTHDFSPFELTLGVLNYAERHGVSSIAGLVEKLETDPDFVRGLGRKMVQSIKNQLGRYFVPIE